MKNGILKLFLLIVFIAGLSFSNLSALTTKQIISLARKSRYGLREQLNGKYGEEKFPAFLNVIDIK